MTSRIGTLKVLSGYVSEDEANELLELAREKHVKTGMRTSDYCICGEVGSSNSSVLCRLIRTLVYCD